MVTQSHTLNSGCQHRKDEVQTIHYLAISADLFRASSVWDFPHSFHPAKPVQPAKPASQASQPARPASQASRASKPQASRHRCQQFFFIGAPARSLGVPQAATGGQPSSQASQAKPASQAGQPASGPTNAGQAGQAGLQASWHRFLRPPGLLASILEASGLPGLEVPPSRLGYLDASNHRIEEVGGRGGSL